MSSHSEIFEELRAIIAEETGNDPASILPESDLIEDLGMEIETNLPPIIKRINAARHIMLNPKEIMADAETVNDILTQVIDEVELG